MNTLEITPQAMTVICNIQQMQSVIYGKQWQLKAFDGFNLSQLYELQEDVIPLYNKAIAAKNKQMTVNRENCESANKFSHVSLTNKNKAKTPLQVRRTGKTQTWKTRPNEFKIPVKYGLYESTYITHLNCNEWNVID